MTKIYRMTDRFKIDIAGVVFVLSPLNYKQKTDIQALVLSGDVEKSLHAARLAVKYSLKSIDGLVEPYDIEFDESGVKDECLDDILNLQQSDDIQMVSLSFLKGIPQKFVNPFTNKELENVKLLEVETGKKN